MTRKQLAKVLAIAKKIRARYDNGNPKAKLDCMCAIISCELSLALAKARFVHELKYTFDGPFGHVFILIDGRHLDLTATQFSNRIKPIVFRKMNKNKHWFWNTSGKTFTNARDLVKELKRNRWPKEQIHPELYNQV